LIGLAFAGQLDAMRAGMTETSLGRTRRNPGRRVSAGSGAVHIGFIVAS
jgi:hypothetical protein